ncbi:hypothetical protein CI102_8877 [Trichoderma harzianum]|uniref:Uncharacterized protein n=1 Tax=Trichoderma harzianum CBS 226.95 TaxID=983964 RepID=A0A2T3ZS23_TRIHA|nr:hypothetical protein M431DRAFT_369501 [Trichoderma harzianum CBS 226.95]PKK46710.1 hypothetical protein CI102_8877 [Trichoderma harzianum]PTB47616.1 hypothetical protein M431DRAFT_369501 [Trichoderma harzianum CBS 226.95]
MNHHWRVPKPLRRVSRHSWSCWILETLLPLARTSKPSYADCKRALSSTILFPNPRENMFAPTLVKLSWRRIVLPALSIHKKLNDQTF